MLYFMGQRPYQSPQRRKIGTVFLFRFLPDAIEQICGGRIFLLSHVWTDKNVASFCRRISGSHPTRSDAGYGLRQCGRRKRTVRGGSRSVRPCGSRNLPDRRSPDLYSECCASAGLPFFGPQPKKERPLEKERSVKKSAGWAVREAAAAVPERPYRISTL